MPSRTDARPCQVGLTRSPCRDRKPPPSVAREWFAVQGRVDESEGKRVTRACRCREADAAAPALRRLRVDASQDYPTLTEPALHNGRRSVRVPRNWLAPASELRAVFPVNLQCRPGGHAHGDGRLPSAAILERVERKPHAVREIQPVGRRRAREECARTDTEVAQAAPNRASKLGRGARREPVANVHEIPTRNHDELVCLQPRFADPVYLRRGRGRIAQATLTQDVFEGCNVTRRGTTPFEQKNICRGRLSSGAAGDEDRNEPQQASQVAHRRETSAWSHACPLQAQDLPLRGRIPPQALHTVWRFS